MKTTKISLKKKGVMINLLMFTLGAFLMHVFLFAITCDKVTTTPSQAIVKQVEDVYVYIGASPVVDYRTLGTLEVHDVSDLISSSRASRITAGKAFEERLKSHKQDLEVYEKLKNIVKTAKTLFPRAQGVILLEEVGRCEVIGFHE